MYILFIDINFTHLELFTLSRVTDCRGDRRAFLNFPEFRNFFSLENAPATFPPAQFPSIAQGMSSQFDSNIITSRILRYTTYRNPTFRELPRRIEKLGVPTKLITRCSNHYL